MQQHRVEPAGPAVAPLRRQLHGGLQQGGLGGLQLRFAGSQPRFKLLNRHRHLHRLCFQLGFRPWVVARAGLQALAHGLLHRRQAPAVFGAHQHHRQAQLAAEGFTIDAHAEAAGLIGHVEHHHRRQLQLLHLQGQAQLAIELAGVEHHQHKVHGGCLEEAAHHGLVLRVAAQVVDARQVHQLQRLPLDAELRLHQVNREARPIADLGVAAGELVEQGGFARVGHAQQGDGVHAARATQAASRRRTISSVMPTRT